MLRHESWPERLIETVTWHQGRPFVWGLTDCATLFADCVLAVVNSDPLGAFRDADRPGWDSERGALRLLAGTGCRSMLEFVTERFDEIVPADARRGDLVFPAAVHALMCPAVVTGAEAVSRDETGFIRIPRTLAARAFKVGD